MKLLATAVFTLAFCSAFARRGRRTHVEEPPPPLEEQLKPSDLKPIKPLSLVGGRCPEVEKMDLVFAIDASSSIGSKNFDTVRQFLENLATAIGVHPDFTHIGALSFTEDVENAFYLNSFTNTSAVVNALRSLPYIGGNTDIPDGMNGAVNDQFVAESGDRPTAKNVLLVLTDGHDSYIDEVYQACMNAKAKDITTIAVGVGSHVNQAELLAIACNDSSHVVDVPSLSDLENFVNLICGTIKGNPCQPDSCNGHGTCTPCGESYYCTCNATWTGPHCGQPIPQPCPFGWDNPPACRTPHDFCNDNIMYNKTLEQIPLCHPHGQCQYSTTQGVYCACDPGWHGMYCEENDNLCHHNPCLHGGTCVDKSYADRYICFCTKFYTGTNCQTPVNLCENTDVIVGNAVTPLNPCGAHGDCSWSGSGVTCSCHHGWTGQWCQTKILYGCNYDGHHYPHNSTWVDGCNTYVCEYGQITKSKALWCPQRCALYNTTRTLAAGLPDTCPTNQNCVPDEVECAKPRCAYPIGWCMPVGMVMVDTINFPTNPPRGYRTGAPVWSGLKKK